MKTMTLFTTNVSLVSLNGQIENAIPPIKFKRMSSPQLQHLINDNNQIVEKRNVGNEAKETQHINARTTIKRSRNN